ncbi:uncharacterized protein EI90DRAFT_3136436 [Cantharellus anzutake]|uniref:uncharacterized protein n=1 Tax=Cantharellus anzutake TaxID=1750568 RepID=UPI0019062343|nr:uncharacterized protein EI90DRAFT_3136436 [Cantharellus anzutake]KAF8313737.1 hypothetical protein EI90DRAFT_3136436 [Cantharellus anzutake]
MSNMLSHNPPMMSLKESASHPALSQLPQTATLQATNAVSVNKPVRGPKSTMDISSIISPHQSTGQQQPHPINTQSTTITVSLPSPPQTSVPPALTNRQSPIPRLTVHHDSTGNQLASTSAPHRPAQMPQSPSRKRSLSPMFGSEAMRPTDQDDLSARRPRKFWKSATGHRRGITIPHHSTD